MKIYVFKSGHKRAGQIYGTEAQLSQEWERMKYASDLEAWTLKQAKEWLENNKDELVTQDGHFVSSFKTVCAKNVVEYFRQRRQKPDKVFLCRDCQYCVASYASRLPIIYRCKKLDKSTGDLTEACKDFSVKKE